MVELPLMNLIEYAAVLQELPLRSPCMVSYFCSLFFDIHDARLPNYLVSGSRYARILWKSTTNPPTRAMWRCGESNFLHFPRPKKNLWQFEHASGSKLVLVGGSLNHGEFTKKFANECNLNQLETFPFRLLDCLVILCS